MADLAPHAQHAATLATQKSLLPLREMTLIGTMGTDNNRRALIRLPDGTISHVSIGDTLRGRRIDAIGPDRLLMSRNGRQQVLSLPSG